MINLTITKGAKAVSKKHKKSRKNAICENIVLATAILGLIEKLIEIIDRLTE